MEHRVPFLDLKALDAPYRDEIKEAVCAAIDSGRYIGGPVVEAFENDLAKATEAPYAVGLSNGLDALRLSLRAAIELGYIHHGDGVIVAANTYIASILAITDNSLQPVMVEPSLRTYNLDTSLVEQSIAEATAQGITVSAIMPVHLYGRACWDGTLADSVRRHGLFVIEDNAQAIGARAEHPGLYGTHTTGGLGHIGAFSFYPTKNIGAIGDAGAIATHDEKIAQTIRALANYGSDRRYHNIYCGFNCRLDTIQAAILGVRLRHLDEISSQRRKHAEALTCALRGCGNIICPETPTSSREHVWHQYVIRVKTSADSTGDELRRLRGHLRQSLEDAGISTDIHYATPPHRQPCYASLGHGALPLTELLADSVLSLPVAAALTPDELRLLATAIANG